MTKIGETGDGGPATAAGLNGPTGIAADNAGNLYIADTQDNVIRKVTKSTGIITRFAGTGTGGHLSTGSLATGVELYQPQGVAVDSAGDVFIADTGNNRVVEVLPSGRLRLVAGNGKAGFGGDGKAATTAELDQPSGVAFDAKGNLYIADTSNDVVRRVDAKTGVITTVAGDFAADAADGGAGGFTGDGGPATDARLNQPTGVALDSAGDLFIADRANNAVREVTPAGDIFTVVNQPGPNGTPGTDGAASNGPATSALLDGPVAVTVDNATDTLLVADTRTEQGVTGVAHSGNAAGPVAPQPGR